MFGLVTGLCSIYVVAQEDRSNKDWPITTAITPADITVTWSRVAHRSRHVSDTPLLSQCRFRCQVTHIMTGSHGEQSNRDAVPRLRFSKSRTKKTDCMTLMISTYRHWCKIGKYLGALGHSIGSTASGTGRGRLLLAPWPGCEPNTPDLHVAPENVWNFSYKSCILQDLQLKFRKAYCMLQWCILNLILDRV